MAYRYNDLNQKKNGGDYDEIFHKNTGSQNTNYKKKVIGNQQILNYHLFSGQYEQQQQATGFDAFDEFNETAKKNREQFSDYRTGDPSRNVESFNKAIDSIHMPFDIQRPVATRDQVKEHYEHEHKSLYSHKRTNDYFNDHQFMPGKYNNNNGTRLDFYSMQSDDNKGFEQFF